MKLLNLSFIASLGIVISSFVLSAAFFYDIDHLLVTHFDAFKGIDFLGTKNDVYLISAEFLIFIIINFALAKFLYPRISFLAWSLAVLNIALGIINLVVVVTIIINN